MNSRLLNLIAIISLIMGGASLFAVPSKSAKMYQFVTSLNPQHHAGAYFKKAHAAFSPAPVRTTDSSPSFGARCLAMFFAVLSALFAGMLLMLTPYGLLAVVFSLGVLYHHRNRAPHVLVGDGLVFVVSFVPVFAATHAFLREIDGFLESPGAQFVFSIAFVVFVALASFSLLGIIQLSSPRVGPAPAECERSLGDFFVLIATGSFSALMLVTQKLAPLFAAARQLNVEEMWSVHLMLAVCSALGFASMIFLCWVIVSFFLKDEYINLWVSDSLSLVAWFSLYKSMLVLRPHIFSWQYNLLLSIVACCAGVYYWMSVRLEITYQYIDMYSKAARADTFLHIFSGWQFFSARILFKRFVAVIAFLAMGSFMVKTYLFYRGITLRDVIIQKLKSL